MGTQNVLERIAEQSPAQYFAWLTLWLIVVGVMVRAILKDLFGSPDVSSDELRRLKTLDRLVRQQDKKPHDSKIRPN